MLKVIKPDFLFTDERGALVQLIHKGYKQVNVITTKKGAFRGGHYHKENKEAFYVISGKLEVVVEERKFSFCVGDFFSIDANDMHSFKFLEDTTLVSMYSKGVELENGKKDIYTGDCEC